MNPSEIIAEVAKLGVALRVEGANLVHRGPRGALRPDLIAKLKARKPDIIAQLTSAKVRPRLVPPTSPSVPRSSQRATIATVAQPTAAPSPRPAMFPGKLLSMPI